MGSLKRFFLIEGFYFNGICTFAPVQGSIVRKYKQILGHS